MRGVTVAVALDYAVLHISTHTPHAGRDGEIGELHGCRFIISTHTAHAGRDRRSEDNGRGYIEFQLTRPMRGVTAASKTK